MTAERTIKADVLERTILSAGVAILFCAGYFAVGLSRAPGKAHELLTPFDRRIPFVARSVWIYLWSYTASAIPIFIIRCHRLFRLTCLAYTAAISVALIFFTALPVTALHLRPSEAKLDIPDASHWAVSTIYSFDPPYNLFPSLHVCLTALAAYAAWKANRWFGSVLFVCLGSVAVAVCTVKQHFVADAIGGLVLAAIAGAFIIGPYQRRENVKVTYSWRGPVSYAFTLLMIYIGFYTSFRLSAG